MMGLAIAYYIRPQQSMKLDLPENNKSEYRFNFNSEKTLKADYGEEIIPI